MPFGPSCEFSTFDQCVKHYSSGKHKKKDPEAYCAVIQSETEEHCKKRMERAVRGGGGDLPPARRFSYDVEGARYTDLETGRMLSQARLEELFEDFLQAQIKRMADLTDALVQGFQAIPEWEVDMRRALKETYGASYLLGRGGRRVMTQSDWGRVGARVRRAYSYLNTFARAMSTGDVSAEQATSRVQMYAGAARPAFLDGMLAGRAASQGVPPPKLPQVPGDGNTQCLSNCRCSVRIDPIPGGWEVYWQTSEDERECQDCDRLGVQWDPLVLT